MLFYSLYWDHFVYVLVLYDSYKTDYLKTNVSVDKKKTNVSSG